MPHVHTRRWLILSVVLAAECMDLLDGTIVNVAAPSIRRDLGASSTALQWMVGGYPLAISIGLVAGGRLGDVYGRRRTFLLGTLGFTLASVLCGLAPSSGALISARLVQGALAALMLPQGFGLLREVFPPDELHKAFAVYGPVLGLAALLGPIVGGGLIDLDLLGSGWRLVFFVNLPLGLAAVAGAAALLPHTAPGAGMRLDLVGTVLIGVAAALLVYPLIQGRELGWPAWTYASMAASVLAFAAFGVHQRRRERAGRDSLVTLSVFAHRGYSAGLVVALLFFAGMIGSVLALTLYLQLGLGFSAVHAGLTLIPWSLGAGVGAGVAGAVLGPRFGRIVVQAGAALKLAGWVLVIATAGAATSSWDLVPGLLLAGLGMGLAVAPLFDTILAAVTDREMGSASGVLNAVQQLGGSIGVAVLGTVFFEAAGRDDLAHALHSALWVTVGLLAAQLAVSPLLPRRARDPEEPSHAVGLDPRDRLGDVVLSEPG